MLIKAQQKNIRQTSRKVLLVANQVKKLGLKMSIDQLAVMTRRSSVVVLKTMKAAIANALARGLMVEELRLKDILVTDGSVLKRMRAVSRGRAFQVTKRTCNLEVILETKDKTSNQSAVEAVKSETSAQEKEK
jgi:ribosomal protein L22